MVAMMNGVAARRLRGPLSPSHGRSVKFMSNRLDCSVCRYTYPTTLADGWYCMRRSSRL